MTTTPPVVKNLLIINVLFFVAKYVLMPKGLDIDNLFGLHHPLSPLYRPWQIITHFFMHANVMHIAFNMFGLWMFGRYLEMIWGGQRFLFFYTITAVSAAFLHFLVVNYQIHHLAAGIDPAIFDHIRNEGMLVFHPDHHLDYPQYKQLYQLMHVPVMGASGALFGLLGACYILFPNTTLMLIFPPIPIKLKYFVTFYGLYELYRGIANTPGDNVAHFAHLGGLIAGIIIVKYWNRNKRDRFY
ncbi:MAG: rhomboid family intramembrane serine protease [Flavobacteriales bacterium]|nr:rhomboid family intramembrane serine protease [Bacteroidota bacterium]MCB9241278.1 rhomboid family intramembrane serine protease [Flavobacteriales bacterium]